MEVRRSGDVYLVPLASALSTAAPVVEKIPSLDGRRSVQFFYRSEVPAVSRFGTITQNPPTLATESSQRIAMPVDVLEQKWDVHYPDGTQLIDNHGPLEPQQRLDRPSVLGSWNSDLRVRTLSELGRQLLAVLVVIGVIALFTWLIRNKKSIMAAASVVALLVLIGILSLIAPAQSERTTFDAFATARAPEAHVGRGFQPADASVAQPEVIRLKTLGYLGMKENDQPAAPQAAMDDDAEHKFPAVGQRKPKFPGKDKRGQEVVDFQNDVAEIPDENVKLKGQGMGGASLASLTPTTKGLLSLAIDFVAPCR